MSFPFDTNDMLFPGMDSILETVQNQYWWGRNEQQTYLPATILSSALDAGNTVTTVLRGGLLLGRVTATGKFKEWNPTGTDGSEVLVGVLPAPLSMLDAGTGADRYTYVQVGGNLLSDRLLVPGNVTEGIVADAQEFNIVNQLVDRGFKLDRHIQYGNANTFRPRSMTAAEVTANAVTALTSDHGRTFDMAAATGTVVFTLPLPQKGLTYTVVSSAAQTTTMTLTATSYFVLPGNAASTSTIAISTGENIRVVGLDATHWAVFSTESTD